MAVDPSAVARARGVLTSQLGDEAGTEEATRWQQAYAGQPGAGLVAFVQEIARRRGLDPTRRQRLRMELIKAVYPDEAGDTTGPSSVAKASTDTEGTSAGSSASNKSGPRPPGQQVCAALIVSILGQSKAADRGELLNGLAQHAAEVGEIPEETVKALANWDGDGDPPVASTDAGLSRIVHAAYLALCEAYGPAEADRLLRRCIQRVERMAAAVEYPPSRLL
ncbi:MAG: hypothetical protein BRD57_05540 [Proteobacteria bacterium SW_6_67_9]|nr:MAG: hypothetical protein BRD57_05540 [Proteobacteria bacterium SW_6_67_9]